jgi:hypothetical protein
MLLEDCGGIKLCLEVHQAGPHLGHTELLNRLKNASGRLIIGLKPNAGLATTTATTTTTTTTTYYYNDSTKDRGLRVRVASRVPSTGHRNMNCMCLMKGIDLLNPRQRQRPRRLISTCVLLFNFDKKHLTNV